MSDLFSIPGVVHDAGVLRTETGFFRTSAIVAVTHEDDGWVYLYTAYGRYPFTNTTAEQAREIVTSVPLHLCGEHDQFMVCGSDAAVRVSAITGVDGSVVQVAGHEIFVDVGDALFARANMLQSIVLAVQYEDANRR
jgi:hypothetical protein